MRTDNILSGMSGLESRAGQYFIRRALVRPADYEEGYWGTIVDPDGKVRDRLSERERFLTNTKTEVEFIRSLPAGRVLDVGCGLGFFLSALDNTWSRHGTELSAFAAEYASKSGEIFVGHVADAHFPDNHFDLVIMHHVIEHIEEPEAMIAEIRRILKPGGQLLLATPDFDSGCARLFGEKYRLLSDGTHVSLFSNDSMHRFLRDFGFVIDKVDYPYFETPYFTADNLSRLFNRAEVSPPFYGNFMTFYCHKPAAGVGYQALREMSRIASLCADCLDGSMEAAGDLLAMSFRRGTLLVWGDRSTDFILQDFVDGLPDGYQATRVGDSSDLGLAQPTVLLAVSADIESAEMIDLLKAARERGIKTIALGGRTTADRPEPADVVIAIDCQSKEHIKAIQLILLGSLRDRMTNHAAQIAEAA